MTIDIRAMIENAKKNRPTPKVETPAKKKGPKRTLVSTSGKSVYDLFSPVNATTVEEMAEQIGIDFIAEKRPQFYQDANGNPIENPDHVVMSRADNDAYLGTVGSNYGVVQYMEMLRFTEELVKKGTAQYLCGGYIGAGEQAYVVMKTDSKIVLGDGHDGIECRFYASTSHNRRTQLMVTPTPYFAATGTVLLPKDMRRSVIKFRHSKKVQDHLNRARKSVTDIGTYMEQFEKSFNMLSKVKMTDDRIETYLEGLIPLEGKEKTTRAENTRERIKEIYRTDKALTLPSCNGTLLGLYFAVCYYADHEGVFKKSKKRDEVSTRILSCLEGDAAKKKAEALGTALTLYDKFKGLSLIK